MDPVIVVTISRYEKTDENEIRQNQRREIVAHCLISYGRHVDKRVRDREMTGNIFYSKRVKEHVMEWGSVVNRRNKARR